MLNIKSQRECFFDDYLIDQDKTTALKQLHRPVRRGVVIEMDQPWEGHTHMHSLVYADRKWRVYYIGRHNVAKLRCMPISKPLPVVGQISHLSATGGVSVLRSFRQRCPQTNPLCG